MDVKLVSQGGQQATGESDISGIKVTSDLISSLTQDTNSGSSKTNNSKNEFVTVKEAQKAADKINKLLEDKKTHIELEQDKDFKYVMIMKVIDNNTNKVINQIPSKQILDMVAQFCEMAGLILDKKV